MGRDSRQRFRVTHPHHSLFGLEFDLIERRARGTGGERAYFDDDRGHRRNIPVEWTDLVAEDPFVVVSAGRAYFRVEDLLELSALIKSLTEPVS